MAPAMTPLQLRAFGRTVEDRAVCDLGAGSDAKLATAALELGATSVVAVDKEPLMVVLPRGVVYRQTTFAQFHREVDRIDLAIVSWPWVADRALLYLIEKSSTVVYFGKNTDLVRCGSPKPRIHHDLWKLLSRRPILAHVPDVKDVLIVYGERALERQRPLVEEEYAALSSATLKYTGS